MEHGITVFLTACLAVGSFAWAVRDPEPPRTTVVFPEGGDGWVYLPPRFNPKVSCAETLAEPASATSLRIIRHQNWMRNQQQLARRRMNRTQQMEIIYSTAGPWIRAVVQRIDLTPETKSLWLNRLGVNTTQSFVAMKSRLAALGTLNNRLIEKQDFSLEGIAGPLIQIAKYLNLIESGEAPEQFADVRASRIARNSVRELRENSAMRLKIDHTIDPEFRVEIAAALRSIENLKAIKSELSSRFLELENELERLKSEFDANRNFIHSRRDSASHVPLVPASDPMHLRSHEGNPESLELANREIYNEMVIFLHELKNDVQLAGVAGRP